MSFRVIEGELIKHQREQLKLSLKKVAERSGGQFTRAALWQWENNIFRPKDENIPALLKALNCNYEAISKPVEVELAA